MCPGQDLNLHDLKRSLGPQPSASTSSATWANENLPVAGFKQYYGKQLKFYHPVRMRGLEPPHPRALPPEDSVSTDFTTCALL